MYVKLVISTIVYNCISLRFSRYPVGVAVRSRRSDRRLAPRGYGAAGRPLAGRGGGTGERVAPALVVLCPPWRRWHAAAASVAPRSRRRAETPPVQRALESPQPRRFAWVECHYLVPDSELLERRRQIADQREVELRAVRYLRSKRIDRTRARSHAFGHPRHRDEGRSRLIGAPVGG